MLKKIRSTSLLLYSTLALAVLGIGCASPIEDPFTQMETRRATLDVQVADLRASDWKKTRVVQSGGGVVQHLGDDLFPGGSLPDYIAQQLASALNTKGVKHLAVKTTDIRLSIPGAKIDHTQVATITAQTGIIAAPVFGILSSLERNKVASAVICISLDNQNFMGNDARLFAFGAEGELKASLTAALTTLRQAIEANKTATSPACEPGWEGGQPR